MKKEILFNVDTIKNDKKYFESMVKYYLKNMYGFDFRTNLIANNIKFFDSVFSDLRKIYKYKNKYNLHWAFEFANKKFHNIMLDILKTQYYPKIQYIIKKIAIENNDLDQLQKDLNTIKLITNHKEKIFKKKAQYFGILSNLITSIDIVISVVLILIISEISHKFNTNVGSFYLGIIFLAFIALFKVSLDRFFIIPKVELFGWRLYIRTVKHYKDILARYEAVILAIDYAIQKGYDAKQIIKMLEKGIEIIKKETLKHKILGFL